MKIFLLEACTDRRCLSGINFHVERCIIAAENEERARQMVAHDDQNGPRWLRLATCRYLGDAAPGITGVLMINYAGGE